VEQTYEPMYKNRIRGIRCGTSWPLTTESISIKGTDCKFGGGVLKRSNWFLSGFTLSARGKLCRSGLAGAWPFMRAVHYY
jgi:hypothetical protein